MFALAFFVIRTIISAVAKDKEKRKIHLKRTGISLAVMFVSVIGFGITSPSVESESTTKEEPEKVEVAVVDESEEIEVEPELTEEEKAKIAKLEEEKKAAAELKAKKDAEAKEKVDAEKKSKDEVAKKTAASAEKDYYLKEVEPQINGVMGVYDRIWTDFWQATFTGLGNGTVDVYTAYENMKEIEHRYTALGKQISNINGDKLSKENKKLLDEFKSELSDAASLRRSSGNEAKKVIDKGTFSPSEMDKLKTMVSYSDNSMMNAIISKTTIDMNLGLLEE